MLMQKVLFLFFLSALIFISSCDNETEPLDAGKLQLISVDVGTYALDLTNALKNTSAPINEPLLGLFNAALDKASAETAIKIKLKSNQAEIPFELFFLENDRKF